MSSNSQQSAESTDYKGPKFTDWPQKESDERKQSRSRGHINEPIRLNRTKPDMEDNAIKYASKSKKDYWNRLKKLNIGRWNGKWSHAGYERNIFKKNLCEILTGHLELKDRQASRVTSLFLSIDLRKFRKYDTEVPLSEGGERDKWPLIIFCISILVCWENGRVHYPDSNAGEDKRDVVFSQIADRLELADDVVISCVGKLRYLLREKLGEPEDPIDKPTKQPVWSLRSSTNKEREGEGYLK